MKRTDVLFCVLMLTPFLAKAQWGDEEMDEKPKLKDRIFTGGGLGMNFSSYSDYISISPLIGYKATDKLATGIGFQYRYTSYKTVSPKVSTSDYGVSPFVRYYVYNPFYLHTEYEYLNYQYVYSGGEKIRKSYNSLMTGGGMFQSMGRRAGLFVMILYNLTYVPTTVNSYSPYASPWVFRAGITAGF